LVENLRVFPPEDFSVTFHERHEETERFGRALDTTLRKAGWTSGSWVVVDVPVITKDTVEVEGDDEGRPAVRRLLDWLDSEGFNPEFVFNPDKKDLSIRW
jgi:hypothetical protein